MNVAINQLKLTFFHTLLDSVDPIFAPATGTRVGGGISYREAYFISEAICETGNHNVVLF